MYKCGWNGCEKAYGTLNHLNAHVTMQSHGIKRTPEGKRHDFLVQIANSLFWLGAIISVVTRTHGRASWSQ
jgi:cob(I)alamin adenosyltransferase